MQTLNNLNTPKPLETFEKLCFLKEAVIYASVEHACCLKAISITALEDDVYKVTLPKAEPVLDPDFNFITDVVEAILYLYSIGIVHGDLKVQNVVKYQGRYRLIDHGMTFLAGVSDLKQDYQSFSFQRLANAKMKRAFGASTSVIRELGWAIGSLILLWRQGNLYTESLVVYVDAIENFIDYPETAYGDLISACFREDFSIQKLAELFNLALPEMRRLPSSLKNRFVAFLEEQHCISRPIAKVITQRLIHDNEYHHWLKLYEMNHNLKDLLSTSEHVLIKLKYKLI